MLTLTAARLLTLTLVTAISESGESGVDTADLPDLFLIQVTAQTFNASGVKHTLDAANQTRPAVGPNLLSFGQNRTRPGHRQNRNSTKKDADGSQIVQDQLGVKANSATDSEALRASLFFNVGLICAYLALFVVFQRWKPVVFLHNTAIQKAPEPYPSWFGMWLSSEEVEEHAGLDSALMVEFCNLGMKICVYLGLPLTAVCLPVYYVMGKNPGSAAAITGDGGGGGRGRCRQGIGQRGASARLFCISGPNASTCTSAVQFVPRSSLDLFSISSLRCNGLAMRSLAASSECAELCNCSRARTLGSLWHHRLQAGFWLLPHGLWFGLCSASFGRHTRDLFGLSICSFLLSPS